MTPARFLGQLGMTFFLVDYGYLCATAYYVYLFTTSNHTILYIGVANDLA